MRILYVFLDGVGLGADDPSSNPFAVAHLPTLTQFTRGQRWVNTLGRVETDISVFIPTDAMLGVLETPQSATGQAAIMTGSNVPARLGYHYGPKPNEPIRSILEQESVIARLTARGVRVSLANVYPSGYIDAIQRGMRLPSANQLALMAGGVRLRDGADYLTGQGLAADLTGEMWLERAATHDAAMIAYRSRLNGALPAPITAFEAGSRLARLAQQADFTMFDQWLTDYVGHRGSMQQAVTILEDLDAALAGVLSQWDTESGLVVITSDHGNLENLDVRGHTHNLVPTLVIGSAWRVFAEGLVDLTGFASAFERVLL